MNQWIKDAEPILAKDMITAPVCSEKASVASSRWDWPNERERRVMIHRLAEAGGELPDIVQKCLEAEKKYGVDTKIYPDDTMFTYDDEWRVVPIIGEPAEKESVAAEDACPLIIFSRPPASFVPPPVRRRSSLLLELPLALRSKN